jgi:thimet oligopeptidase
VIANFPKATKDSPALLKRDDVITFFHEFGHAIHTLLGTTKLISQAGTHVKTDFVETPSQMLEEFMWDPHILESVTKHYKTGEKLPKETIEKIMELKRFDSGIFVLGQLYYAFLSLDLFKKGADKDIKAIARKLKDEINPFIAYNDKNNFYASFGHLTGYGAKYYSYMWSKVFALDLFDHIKNKGYFSGIGQQYADAVLAQGGSVNPFVLLERFLSRKPNQDAFIKDLGL